MIDQSFGVRSLIESNDWFLSDDLRFGIANVSELGLKLSEMLSRGGVDDDRFVASSGLHFANSVAKTFQSATGLRSTEIHEQFAVEVRHAEKPQLHSWVFCLRKPLMLIVPLGAISMSE